MTYSMRYPEAQAGKIADLVRSMREPNGTQRSCMLQDGGLRADRPFKYLDEEE